MKTEYVGIFRISSFVAEMEIDGLKTDFMLPIMGLGFLEFRIDGIASDIIDKVRNIRKIKINYTFYKRR